MGQCLPTQQALPPADSSSSSTSQPAISATFYNHNDVIQNTLVVNSNDDHYYDINIFNFPNYHPTTAGSSTNYHSYRAGWPENNSAPFPPPSVLVQRMERLGMEAAPPGHDDSPKKVNRYVDVRKDTLQLVLDEDLSSYLVSFTFDALVDGSFTICWFAEEGANCMFTPECPDIFMPIKFPYRKGLGQTFVQKLGTGIDLGFFELDKLSKFSQNESIFPLLIHAEPSLPSISRAANVDQQLRTCNHVQITQAIVKKNIAGDFQVRVLKQRQGVEETYRTDNSDEDNIETGEEYYLRD